MLKKVFQVKYVILLAAFFAFTSLLTGYGNTSILAADKEKAFSWDAYKGTTIRVLLNQHPYSEAIVKKLPEFEAKTGIKVDYAITPESNYFDKLSTALNSRNGDPDLFMLGPTIVWEYAPADYLAPLDGLANNKSLTSPDYDMKDFFPTVLNTFKWDRQFGHKTGKGPLWAIPMGCEVYDFMYNKKIFEEKNLQPPKTTADLLALCKKLNEFDGKGTYALAIRGAKDWATTFTSYFSMYTMWGAKDFAIKNGKLVSLVNSKAAVEMTDFWVKCIKAGGAPGWSGYTWYQAAADFGAKKAAMLYCADNMGWYQNVPGGSQEAGNIAWAPAPLPPGKSKVYSNFWCWALSMNKASKNKEASWLFMQYFTSKEHLLWAGVNAKQMDPVRKSIMDSKDYKAVISKATGFEDAFNKTITGTQILYTPQPYLTQALTEWAGTLQDIVSGKYKSTQEGMNALKTKLDSIVSDVQIK